MLSFNQGFIGYKPNSILSFSGSDDENQYHSRLASSPVDWYYRHTPLTYSHNDVGHRSKNINQVDLTNYILCIGCSHTEGIGNYVHDTYPHQTAELLNCDYYNLGLGGSGLDIMLHNLTTWLLQVTEHPRLIVWQWTDQARYLTVEDYSTPHVITHGLWENDRNVTDFILAGDSNNFFASRIKAIEEYLNTVSVTKNIPIIQVSYQEKNAVNKIFYQSHDLARDGRHYGVESNKNLAIKIADKYQHEFKNN